MIYAIIEFYYSYVEEYEDKVVFVTLDKEEACDKIKKLNEIKQSHDVVYRLKEIERVK